MTQKQIQELIEISKDGDTKAFGILVGQFQTLVFRLAFRLLCNDDEAKDIVQEVFIRVWTQLRKYKPEYQFSTWIYKITSNLCYDRLRSLKHNRELIKPGIVAGLNISSAENIESSMINRELKDLIIYFTEGLTPKQKLVFTLSDIEELNPEEIERITGLSAGKIKSNLYLARKYIRNKIEAINREKHESQ